MFISNNIESYSYKIKGIILFHIIAITYVGITSSISYFWAVMFLLYLLMVYIEIIGEDSLKSYFKANNFYIIIKNKFFYLYYFSIFLEYI